MLQNIFRKWSLPYLACDVSKRCWLLVLWDNIYIFFFFFFFFSLSLSLFFRSFKISSLSNLLCIIIMFIYLAVSLATNNCVSCYSAFVYRTLREVFSNFSLTLSVWSLCEAECCVEHCECSYQWSGYLLHTASVCTDG